MNRSKKIPNNSNIVVSGHGLVQSYSTNGLQEQVTIKNLNIPLGESITNKEGLTGWTAESRQSNQHLHQSDTINPSNSFLAKLKR